MSLAEFEKGQIWRLDDLDYRIISVSANEKECLRKGYPLGDLVRGQMVGGEKILHGTSKAWKRHAEKVS